MQLSAIRIGCLPITKQLLCDLSDLSHQISLFSVAQEDRQCFDRCLDFVGFSALINITGIASVQDAPAGR